MQGLLPGVPFVKKGGGGGAGEEGLKVIWAIRKPESCILTHTERPLFLLLSVLQASFEKEMKMSQITVLGQHGL